MPLNTSYWTGFTAGTMTAAEINRHIEELEVFINSGIIGSDLKSTPWVKNEHIDPADFYGAPAPRWEGVSSAVHHRRTNNSREHAALFVDDVAPNKWVTVHGLGARVRVHPQVARTVGLEVCATWYAYEGGGVEPYAVDTSETSTELCAEFALFIDGVQQTGTLRELFRGSANQVNYARKHHTINFFAPDISDGIHDVSVKIRVKESAIRVGQMDTTNGKRYHKFIWVRSRVMKAEPFYL
mgnify:CR=1 FL=1